MMETKMEFAASSTGGNSVHLDREGVAWKNVDGEWERVFRLEDLCHSISIDAGKFGKSTANKARDGIIYSRKRHPFTIYAKSGNLHVKHRKYHMYVKSVSVEVVGNRVRCVFENPARRQTVRADIVTGDRYVPLIVDMCTTGHFRVL